LFQIVPFYSLLFHFLIEAEMNESDGKFPWIPTTCVLLVDVQEAFYTNIDAVRTNFPLFKQNVIQLLRTARQHQLQVIHIRAQYDLEHSLWIPWWKELNPEKREIVLPTPESFSQEEGNEKVIIKHTFDGFLNTDLDEYLKQQKITTVIVGGLVTSCCVLMTTIGALLRGYRSIVVEDCCGDRTIEKHNTTLNNYGSYLFQRVRVDNLLQECNSYLKKE